MVGKHGWQEYIYTYLHYMHNQIFYGCLEMVHIDINIKAHLGSQRFIIRSLNREQTDGCLTHANAASNTSSKQFETEIHAVRINLWSVQAMGWKGPCHPLQDFANVNNIRQP